MKKIFYSIVFLLALVSGTATAEQIDISKIQNSGMSRPKVRAYVPMTASIENSVVTVDFQYSVGVATISICDSDGNVVFSNLYDTDSSLEAVIPLDALESGTYTIYISYGSSTFNGLFDI